MRCLAGAHDPLHRGQGGSTRRGVQGIDERRGAGDRLRGAIGDPVECRTRGMPLRIDRHDFGPAQQGGDKHIETGREADRQAERDPSTVADAEPIVEQLGIGEPQPMRMQDRLGRAGGSGSELDGRDIVGVGPGAPLCLGIGLPGQVDGDLDVPGAVSVLGEDCGDLLCPVLRCRRIQRDHRCPGYEQAQRGRDGRGCQRGGQYRCPASVARTWSRRLRCVQQFPVGYRVGRGAQGNPVRNAVGGCREMCCYRAIFKRSVILRGWLWDRLQRCARDVLVGVVHRVVTAGPRGGNERERDRGHCRERRGHRHLPARTPLGGVVLADITAPEPENAAEQLDLRRVTPHLTGR